MKKLKIDKELKKLIPPLSKDEYEQLEKNLLKEGWRGHEAIVLWDGFIIDGHHRYELCNKNNIDFRTIEMDFDTREDVKLWIINNQQGRRNLTDGWKWELIQVKKKIKNEKGRDKQIQAGKMYGEKHPKEVLSKTDKISPHNTRKQLAKELDWSTGKVAMADIVWKEGNEELKEEVKKGEKTFNKAYSEIKKKKRKKEIEKKIEKLETENLEKPDEKYDVIVIDPPWKVDFDYDPDHYMGRVANPYPEMTIEEIKNIELPDKDDCILWLWTTQSQIWNAKEIMNHWEFKYKGILTWNKKSMGIGKWLRKQCEFCLLGVKGKPIWTATDFRDIIEEQKTSHSTKPEKFYEIVGKKCVGKKIDYFARKKRKGWDSWGLEVE